MIPDVGLIMVCAGRGKRLGYKDKAFLKLKGKPLFLHAFKAFRKFKRIKQIVFVFRESQIRSAQFLVKDSRAFFVKGGKHRKDSVLCGLKSLGKDIKYVLIHDGARPLVSGKIIRGVLAGLKRYPAVIPAVGAGDTVKAANKGFITKTLDRRAIFLAQTPQGFKKDVLLKAFQKFKRKALTDDAQFIERLGRKVKIVEGSRYNIKITYPQDLKLAEALLK